MFFVSTRYIYNVYIKEKLLKGLQHGYTRVYRGYRSGSKPKE